MCPFSGARSDCRSPGRTGPWYPGGIHGRLSAAAAAAERLVRWAAKVSEAGKLDHYRTGVRGYFHESEEEAFPWDTLGSHVWFSLLVVEEGKIHRYGFTASKSGKSALRRVLASLDPSDESLLLGVWNGERRTDLFVLQHQAAIEKLAELE